jgi:hypothetical protein
MRWRSTKRGRCDRTEWHLWFAWHPVRLNLHTRVWLETVERKGSMALMADSEGYPYEHWEFQYRPLDTVK